MGWSKVIGCTALVTGLLGASATPALADSYSIRDPRDVRNPSAIDFTSVRTGHRGPNNLLQAATLERKISPRAMASSNSFIDFLISTDSNLNDIERRIYILGGRRFRVYVTNGSGRRLIGRGAAYHPNARTLGAIVSKDDLGDPQGYFWFAVAVSNGGAQIDYAPTVWETHDLTAPIQPGNSTYDLTSATTDATNATFPVTATLTDTGWMDLHAADLRWRPNGASAWTQGASEAWTQRHSLDARLLPRTFQASITLPQGSTDETCVAMSDFAGNWAGVGAYVEEVPYDDTNAAIVPVNGTPASLAGDFGGTHTVLTQADGSSATITVPAGLARLVLISGSSAFTADVSVNGGATTSFNDTEVFTSDLSLRALTIATAPGWNLPGGGDDVISINLTSGELDLDGYLGVPATVVSANVEHCGGQPLAAVTSGASAVEPMIRMAQAGRAVASSIAPPR